MTKYVMTKATKHAANKQLDNHMYGNDEVHLTLILDMFPKFFENTLKCFDYDV